MTQQTRDYLGVNLQPNKIIPEEYSIDWFIEFFESIPEDKWCIGYFGVKKGAHCALGHCIKYDNMYNNKKRQPLYVSSLTTSHLEHFLPNVILINDNVARMYSYLGNTPKERIVNALKALKNK